MMATKPAATGAPNALQQRDGQVLHQELAGDTPPARAEGRPHRHLAGTLHAAREVGA